MIDSKLEARLKGKKKWKTLKYKELLYEIYWSFEHNENSIIEIRKKDHATSV